MKIIASAPHFFVTDLKESLEFYVDVLDFEKPRLWGEPPNDIAQIHVIDPWKNLLVFEQSPNQ